jgi:hypothetical protein
MDVRAWWNNAWGVHQAAVPVRFGRESGLAGIPWSFLLSVVKELLTWHVRINAAQLDRDWQRAEQDCALRVDNCGYRVQMGTIAAAVSSSSIPFSASASATCQSTSAEPTAP